MKITVIIVVENCHETVNRIERKIDTGTHDNEMIRGDIQDLNRWTRTQLDLIHEDV